MHMMTMGSGVLETCTCALGTYKPNCTDKSLGFSLCLWHAIHMGL
jgi:hypothetical protein